MRTAFSVQVATATRLSAVSFLVLATAAMGAGPQHVLLHRAKLNKTSLWTATAGCAIADEATIYNSYGDETYSPGTMKVTPLAAQTLVRVTLTADLSPAVNLTNCTHIRMRYYVPAHTSNYTGVVLSFLLYSDAGKTQYRQYNPHNFAGSPTHPFTPGWHTLIVPKALFQSEAGFVQTNLLSYRIQLYNATIPVVPLYFDELAFLQLTQLAKARVAINVDDCNTGGKTVLAAVLARGLTATAYMVPDAVGKTAYDLGGEGTPYNFMSLDDILEMSQRGILFGNHGYHSYKYALKGLTPGLCREEFDRAAEWMIARGLGRGAHYIALPGGELDRAGLDALRGYAQIRFVAEMYSAGESQRADLTNEAAAPNFPYWIDPYTPACTVTGLGDATAMSVYNAIKAVNGVFIGLEHSWGGGVGTFLDTVAADVAAGTVECVTMDQLAPTPAPMPAIEVDTWLERVRRLGTR